MQNLLERHWHHLPVEEVLDLLDTSPDTGLDSFDVGQRQERFGPNALTPRKGHGPLVRFLLQFHQALVYILLAATVVTAFLGEWVDSGVILGVVLLNSVIGFVQESKALGAIEALAKALKTEATVLRAGERRRIDASELVPGDLVLLQSGDKVPADLRLLRARELQVDESALTGESAPVQKHSGTLDHDTALADRVNMTYSSTLVTYGTGRGIVVATGDGTEIGRISQLIATAVVLATPLTRKIAQFSHVLLYVILGLAGVTFVAGLWYGDPWVDTFMAAVALAVAMIPEGLPAVLTITLAIGVARMAKRHAIIRKLPAVETLGSTTVICSDKTGTLTRNEMTVQEIWAGDSLITVSGIGYVPQGEFQRSDQVFDPQADPALLECLRAGLLCSDSLLRHDDEGWRIEGDPTEGALVVSASKAGLVPETLHREWPRLDAIPFESAHQYMATLHDTGRDQPRVAYLKGSVESLLQRCDRVLGPTGDELDLDAEAIHRHVEQMAAQGLRVLAFARRELPVDATAIDHETVSSGLTLLGLQGMIDPPREEAVSAVRACLDAGVRVKMITGDHAGTAAAIAGQIGLDGSTPEGGLAVAITGRNIEAMSDAELTAVVEDTAVFARVTPEQKFRLVEALQARGHIVAMTGDGVNDAPALRRADIGVAMGVAGTEVAKEAADMVLTDDNFASIEAAVEEGRGVFDNLMKFITWILPTNAGQGLVILTAVFAGATLPVLPVQALWINMTTAVLLGLPLAFEPREPGIMRRPPRDPATPILSGALAFRVVLVGFMLLAGSFGLFELALYNGAEVAEARTIAVNVFAVGQAFYLLNCRSLTLSMFHLGLFTNLWVWGGIGAMLCAQLLFTYQPTMNLLFHTAPIGLVDWMYTVAVGIVIYIVIVLEKWLRRRSMGRARSPSDRSTPSRGPTTSASWRGR